MINLEEKIIPKLEKAFIVNNSMLTGNANLCVIVDKKKMKL